MEHRWHPREMVDISVTLFHEGLPVSCGRAYNLSATGLFLTPTVNEVNLNAPVELEFTVNNRYGLQRFRIPAQVMHQSAEGTGLMFHAHQPKLRNILDMLLATFLPKFPGRMSSG